MNEIIELATSSVAVQLDLTRGATITHIGRNLEPDSNVLAWYEFDDIEELPIEYPHGESEHYWMSRYRGGWQLLTPSADTECDVGGRHHSFHGDSSILPWHLVSESSHSIVHEVTIFEALHVLRTIRLEESASTIEVDTTISNIGMNIEPLIKVEHIAYRGSDVGVVNAPKESIWKFSNYVDEGYAQEFLWRDMEKIGVDIRHRNMNEEGRLVYLLRKSEGWIEWQNPDFGQRVRTTWNPADFPHLWYWQENGGDIFPFHRRAKITALEPASVPPRTRLVGAVEQNIASLLKPGEQENFSIRLQIL